MTCIYGYRQEDDNNKGKETHLESLSESKSDSGEADAETGMESAFYIPHFGSERRGPSRGGTTVASLIMVTRSTCMGRI